MRPFALALALTTAFAAASAPAAADVVRKKDRRAGVTFRLSGKHLTMKLSEQANARTAKKLLGKRVAAACGTSARGGKVYDKVFTWPEERASVAVDLDRDISGRVAWCLLEDARSGGDIALVEFR